MDNKTLKNDINNIVRYWAYKNNGCFHEAWSNLYKEFNKENKMYIGVRAKYLKTRPLDLIEGMNKLDNLKSIAVRLYGLAK